MRQKWRIWRKNCNGFSEYSNQIAKRVPFDENGNSGKNTKNPKISQSRFCHIRHIHQNRPFLCSSTRVYKGTEQARRVANYNLLDIMAFSTSMDTKKEKNIYAFAKVTKTRILHSLEEVKGLVNGKPDQIYKIFSLQSNEAIEFLQQQCIYVDPEETEGQFSQEVRYLKPDKEDLLFHTLVSICKLENVMNAVKSQ